MSKGGGSFGKVIAVLSALILVIAAVGVVLYFTLRSQGITFYVEHEGKRYLGGMDGGSLEFVSGGTYDFSVKSLTGGDVNYSVSVMANSANTVRFIVGDEFHCLYEGNAEADDYSSIFSLKKRVDGFSVSLPVGLTVKQAIELKYDGDITLMDELSDDIAYFVITITVDESSVVLWFMFYDFIVSFDPPSIVF